MISHLLPTIGIPQNMTNSSYLTSKTDLATDSMSNCLRYPCLYWFSCLRKCDSIMNQCRKFWFIELQRQSDTTVWVGLLPSKGRVITSVSRHKPDAADSLLWDNFSSLSICRCLKSPRSRERLEMLHAETTQAHPRPDQVKIKDHFEWVLHNANEPLSYK